MDLFVLFFFVFILPGQLFSPSIKLEKTRVIPIGVVPSEKLSYNFQYERQCGMFQSFDLTWKYLSYVFMIFKSNLNSKGCCLHSIPHYAVIILSFTTDEWQCNSATYIIHNSWIFHLESWSGFMVIILNLIISLSSTK